MTDNEKKDDIKLEVKKPGIEGDDKTAKIPKLNKVSASDDKKIVLNSGTDSAIRPSDATRIAPSPIAAPPGAEETIQMDKSDVKDVPELAATKKETDDSTQKTLKPPAPISQTAKSKTIKLKPLKPVNTAEDNQEETLSMDRDALLDQDMPSSLGAAPKTPGIEDEATIKIQKPTTTKPVHPTPSVPGAKETIKLRPSNATPPPLGGKDESQETISMSKKTIRLVPKKPGNTADDSTQKTAKPSAPTVKLGAVPPAAPAVAAPPPAAAPSAQTVKMPEPAAQPPKANNTKKTLKLKATPKPPAAAPPGAGGAPPAPDATESDAAVKGKKGKKAKEPKAPKEKVAGENPKAMMTIAAFFAFLLMAYYAWMAVGQWAENEQDLTKDASVPMLKPLH